MRFYATCPAGLEQMLGQELDSLGIGRVRPLTGQVSFEGPLRDAYTACMWSRLASSIVAVIASFECHGADDLYRGAADVDWTEQLSPTSTFAVFARGEMDGIDNSMFAAQRIKDAVVDQFVAKVGTRPNVDPKHPDLRIRLTMHRDHATLGIDLTGEPLFRRGYERAQQKARIPALRPDYAAAVLWAADWQTLSQESFPSLGVAFSGAGTLAVEGAAIAMDTAPGLTRARWGFTHWLGHSERSWSLVRNEAERRRTAGADRPVTIVCTDTRLGFATDTRATMRSAGLAIEPVFVPVREATDFGGKLTSSSLLVLDLSWPHADEGPREAEALSLTATIAATLPENTPAAAIARDGALDALFDEEPLTEDPVQTGKDEARIVTYRNAAVQPAATVTLKSGAEVPVLVPTTDQFAARLEKDAKERAGWAESEDVTCYRVYDQDLPDYNVALDLYKGTEETPGTWLVCAEYAAPKEIDPEKTRRRLIDVLTVAPRVLGVRASDVALRVRSHSKGGSQYAAPADITRTVNRRIDAALDRKRKGKGDGRPRTRRIDGVELPLGAVLVEEGGLTFEVNLQDRLDTGLFLDHREVRTEIREMAKRMTGAKRFLNLFCYTGTGTVYAADGGAEYTTSVDLSWNYLDWARRNMERNGYRNPRVPKGEPRPDDYRHEYVKADVLQWVDEQRKTRNRWDLIYCDPPTFSNSSDMKAESFDVQRDHAELLIGISRLLTRDGVCLFSCNLRNFAPDVEKLARAGVEIEDVTEGTIPHDFERNAKVHHVYLVKRTPMTEEKRREIEERKRRGDHGRYSDRTMAPDSVRRAQERGGRPRGNGGPRRDGGRGRDDSRGSRSGGFKRDDRKGGFKRDGRSGGFKRDDCGHGATGRKGPAGQNRKGQGYRSGGTKGDGKR